MADTTQDQEPSMEEILASIRKIISDDGATVEPIEKTDDVLELTEEPAPAPEPVAATAPVIDMEDTPPPAPMVEPETVPAALPTPTATIDLGDSLLSETAAQASASALSGLSSMMNDGSHAIASFPIGEGTRTLESMVLELIKPYLKSWLDANLPTLVEKIVQKEIRKITRTMN